MINKEILHEGFLAVGPKIHFLSPYWRGSIAKFSLCFKLSPSVIFTVMSLSE